MNKAWMIIATLLLGCGGNQGNNGPPPTQTLTCAPDSDAINVVSSGDALSLIKGSWKVCSPGGDGGTPLDGIQIDADGSWRGLKTVGGDLVVDYTHGGPSSAINKDGLPDKTVLIDLWRYGGGKYQVTAQVFKGPRMDLNFQGTGYAGGLFLGDAKAILPPAAKCDPYIKPLVPTAANQIDFRLKNTKWARCGSGVGPFPDQSNFDGIEFTDTQFFALKNNGAGSLQRDSVAFPPMNWTMQDNTADDGPGGWVLAVSTPAGATTILRMAYFDESPTPRLFIQHDQVDGQPYASVYQRIQ